MIILDSVSKSYGHTSVVRAVSLIAMPGKISGLLGPNGAGKTTILNTICAQFIPDEGTVTVCGKDAAAEPVAVKALIGYVSEQPALYTEYTSAEFLRFVLQLRSIAMPAIDRKGVFESVVEQCGLQTVLHKKIRHLSKGYKQRVSFAQALIGDPPVFILDEPVSGLDPAQMYHIRGLITALAEKGKTVLLSTHLMQEAQSLCNMIYILSEGHIAASGTAQAICDQTSSNSLEDAFMYLTRKTAE